jgi:hypothetical protein
MHLAHILELLETVVLLAGFDNPVSDVQRRIGWSTGTARALTRLVPEATVKKRSRDFRLQDHLEHERVARK